MRAARGVLRDAGRARNAMRVDAGSMPGGRAMKRVIVTLAMACAGCAATSLDLGPSDASTDGCDTDAHDVDASIGDAAPPPPDAVVLDHGTNGADPDAALPRCMSNEDCSGWATCQMGLCCSGVMVGDKCTCGDGPGCDLLSACCVPFASTTQKLECVTNCETACGCAQAR
jgi:hypothetical protein